MIGPSPRIIFLGAAVLIALTIMVAGRAWSHEVRPAFLQVTELSDNRYDVLWKQPTFGTVAVRLVPHIGGGLLEAAPTSIVSEANFEIRIWRGLSAGPEGLEGRKLQIQGLDGTITDVLVSITLANGDSVQRVLRPQAPNMTLNMGKGFEVSGYLALGIEHILTGIDHLAFVLGLMLLVRQPMTLLKTITAFTVAHSISLGATTLKLVTLRPAIVEGLVALSVVFVACELVRHYRGGRGLTVRYPWVIAFTFGLLHGFAFAGALAQIGLPPDAIPLSLLLFNVGVEVGQLMFVVAVVAIGWALSRFPTRLPDWTRWVPPYAIGSLSMFWFIERIGASLS